MARNSVRTPTELRERAVRVARVRRRADLSGVARARCRNRRLHHSRGFARFLFKGLTAS